MPRALKSLVFNTLANPLIGRPLRKIAWTLLLSMRQATGLMDRLFSNLPYVRRCNATLGLTMGHMGQVINYYRTLKMDLDYTPIKPRISVLVPVYNPPLDYFKQCLQSVVIQTYEDWELCIVDDASTDPAVWEVIREYEAKYPGKVKAGRNEANVHISATSNRCLELAAGEFVALLDHDDRLYPNALAEVVRHINLNNQPEILYSDEQVISAEGDPIAMPFFKPGWSPQLHLRVNYTTHLSVYRRNLLTQIGGFRAGFEGSQDHDLMLRAVEATSKPICHIPLVLYQWRAHSQSTASGLNSKPYAAVAGEKAVADHLKRQGRQAKVSWDAQTEHYRVHYQIPVPQPFVSLVICTKDKPDIIKNCLNSILSESTYSNYEIILVDNGTTDSECLAFFEDLEARQPRPFKRVVFSEAFNFAAMNNVGVSEAKGEFVVLLNNDTVVITPEWLEEMVQLAQLPETGAVGPLLLFENGKVQHAGVSLADRSVAFHICGHLDPDDNHYWNTINTVHETAAVTGACLCIRRSVYNELGGLRENFVANGYGDVEFCIRLMKAGYRNVYTPHARLCHLESPSRKVSFEFFERSFLLKTCGQEIINDPYFNPNFERYIRYQPSIYSMHFQLTEEGFQYLLWNSPADWSEEDFNHKRSRTVALLDMPLSTLFKRAIQGSVSSQ